MDLLGKKKLETKLKTLKLTVTNLEKESETLSRQLEKREEKIKKLTRSYQDANQALKNAEHKIVTLQAKENREEVETVVTEKISSKSLTISKLKRLIQRLETCSSPQEDLLTTHILDQTNDIPPSIRDIVKNIDYESNIIVFHYPMLFTLALVPPFPLKDAKSIIGKSFDLSGVKQILDTPVLVVAAHAGETLMGVALSSESFEEHQIIKSTVKEKHTKGGWSQRRFERLREEDLRQHSGLVLERLPLLLESYRPIISYAVLSGDSSLTKFIKPALEMQMPVLEKNIDKFDRKKVVDVLEDVYKFTIVYK